MPPNLTVGIIGGGIGGVAAAVALHQAGIDADVYERAPALREVGSGLSLWPNATRALRQLGVLDEVASRCGPSTNFLVRSAKGRVLMNLALGATDVPALCAHRADLLLILLAKLPQSRIHLGHELVRIEDAKLHPTAVFSNGRRVRHDAIVGADGIRSQVRAQFFGRTEPVYRGYTVWRGVGRYRGHAMPAGHYSETWGRGRRFGILGMDRHRFTWYATANGAPEPGRSAGDRKRSLAEAFAGWHAPIPELIDSTPAETMVEHPAADRPSLRSWARGAVTLMGDAAHPLTPNLGQGGCMAIEDAVTLAKCFAREHSVQAALRKYESLRLPRTRHVAQRSRWMGWIGQWENAALVAGRDVVTRLLPPAIFERNLRRLYSHEV